MGIQYSTFEKLAVKRPVNRVSYFVENARNKRVLDLGCYDETSLFKRGTGEWLIEELSKTASFVLGLDNSAKIPDTGISINAKTRIVRGDAGKISVDKLPEKDFDLITAGELIEHLPNTLEFFTATKKAFPGKQLICSTPNSISISNVLLGAFKREATHQDHLQVYSYKTLNTLCLRAGFAEWEIIPYHIYFSDIISKSPGLRKILLILCEKAAVILENLFPLLSGGLILNIKRM
jgi:SAM-dependent methyltransferase